MKVAESNKTFSLRGREYRLSKKDQLYCRKETIGGHEFEVPLHINRIPGGWQIRIKRVTEDYYSKAFFDSSAGRSGSASSAKAAPLRMEASLRAARRELRQLFRSGAVKSRAENRFISLENQARQDPSNAGTKELPGLNVTVVLPRARSKERTPFINISARLRHAGNLMLGPSFSTSIFNMTAKKLEAQLIDCTKARKVMEDCVRKGRPYFPKRLEYLSYSEEQTYREIALQLSTSLDDLLDDIEDQWKLKARKGAAEVLCEVSEQGTATTVFRKKTRKGVRQQKKTFRRGDYTSDDQYQRMINLYAAYLLSERATVRPGSGRTALTPAEYNQRIQKKTGITGISYLCTGSGKRFEFISVFMEGDRKIVRTAFGVRKLGFEGAFIEARRDFNSRRGHSEGETFIKMMFTKMLPTLLKDLSQSVIDEFGLAEYFEGVSKSVAVSKAS